MNKRKTEKTDLESKRLLFVEIGLVVALAVILAAFEWRQYDIQKVEIDQREDVEVMEDIVIQTEQKEKTPPPKAVQTSTTILNVVKNDIEIENEIIIDVETDEDMEIEEYVPIEVEEEEVEEQEIFIIVENQPEFPGGEQALYKFIRDNVKYPSLARETGIEGTVYIQFVVEPDGRVSNVKVVRSVGGGCDEEAVRVVKAKPKWKPGSQRGKNVRVSFTLPIKFSLQKAG